MAQIIGTPQNDAFQGDQDLTQVDDTMFGGPGVEDDQQNTGDDIILGLTGNDVIRGGDGNDQLEGGDGDDQLFGEDDDDLLFGGSGSDTLDGGDGNDDLDGGSGNDPLIGGLGLDRAAYPGLIGSINPIIAGATRRWELLDLDGVSLYEVEIPAGISEDDVLDETSDDYLRVNVTDLQVGGNSIDTGEDSLSGVEVLLFNTDDDEATNEDEAINLRTLIGAGGQLPAVLTDTPTPITSAELEFTFDGVEAGDVTYTIETGVGEGNTLFLDNGDDVLDAADDTVLEAGGTFTQADINVGNLFYQHDSTTETESDTFIFSVATPDDSNAVPIGTFSIANVIAPLEITVNDEFSVDAGSGARITTADLEADSFSVDNATQVVYTLGAAPSLGSLFLDEDGSGAIDGDESALAVGETFSQADIDAGLLTYVNTESGEADSFEVTVNDTEDVTELADDPSATFDIGITAVQPTFDLDVDENGDDLAFTDGLSIFRFLGNLGEEFMVPADNSDLTQAEVFANIQDAGDILDVDENGDTLAFTDGLSIFRFLGNLGEEFMVPADNSDLTQAEVFANIQDLAV